MSNLLDKNAPRLLIWIGDLLVCFLALIVAYQLRFNFAVPTVELVTYPIVFPVVIGVRALIFILFRTYQGIIRYTSTRDAMRILITLTSGSVLLALSNPVSYYFTEKYLVLSSLLSTC